MQSRIMICGEAWGAEEARLKRPFVGASGHELDTQLQAVGIRRDQCLVTNVVNAQPPPHATPQGVVTNDIEVWFANKSTAKRDHIPEIGGRYPLPPITAGLRTLQAQLDRFQPSLILALGNTPLWALTGLTGVVKWRGSILEATGGPVEGHGAKLIPTLHPAYILREYQWRIAALTDMQRAKREAAFPEIRRPAWDFTIPATVQEARDWFETHVFSRPITPLVADVENIIGPGHLICLGFAADRHTAICIPFMHRAGLGLPIDYWNVEDELALTEICIRALRERPIIFHNGLHDVQIIARQWGIAPWFAHDTMVGQHVLYPGMFGGKIDPVTGKADKKGSSLSLAFCASIYCEYFRHWKDDGRSWDAESNTELEYWHYNCEDTVRTYEVFEEQQKRLKAEGLIEPYQEKMSDFGPVLAMMFRGMRFDRAARFRQSLSVARQMRQIQDWINTAVGHPLNIGSTPQMRKLFFDDFEVPPVINRKTKQPTTDSKTGLPTIVRRRPLLRPLVERIEALRSLETFKENFLKVKLSDSDKRLRGAFGVAGTETMRFVSNANAFNEGTNLQNIPRPPKE